VKFKVGDYVRGRYQGFDVIGIVTATQNNRSTFAWPLSEGEIRVHFRGWVAFRIVNQDTMELIDEMEYLLLTS
jgi:hypothetical protein